MSDWAQHYFPAGTAVYVFNIEEQYLGKGSLVHPYNIKDPDEEVEIQMENGRILLGCECWWIPVSETKGELG